MSATNPGSWPPIPNPFAHMPAFDPWANPTNTVHISSIPLSTTTSTTSIAVNSASPTSSPSSSRADPLPVSASNPTSSVSAAVPSFGTSNESFGPSNMWSRASHGAQIAIILFVILVVFVIIMFSFWFCCGGRARWARRKQLRSSSSSVEHLNPGREGMRSTTSIVPGNRSGSETEQRNLPMQQISPVASPSPTPNRSAMNLTSEVPPPRYEEIVPAKHQRLAGGMAGQSTTSGGEEMGVISDGKMPVGEMVFEDVVVNGSGGDEQLRGRGMFETGTHKRVGDTTGHTNT